MQRDIKQVLVAWANVRRSVKTGLEYPYKSPSVPYSTNEFDSRPLLSESEADLVDKAVLKLAKVDQISHSILKSVYINGQSCRKLARNTNATNNFICAKLKTAEIYILSKIDNVMDVVP